MALVVSSKLPVTTLPEFIAYAKANPGKLSYGTSGVGTSTHLGVVLFQMMAGIDIVHVPYKGGGPATVAVVAGEVPVYVLAPAQASPFLKAGRLRGLGVSAQPLDTQLFACAERFGFRLAE